jgi:hypothetical protein
VYRTVLAAGSGGDVAGGEEDEDPLLIQSWGWNNGDDILSFRVCTAFNKINK